MYNPTAVVTDAASLAALLVTSRLPTHSVARLGVPRCTLCIATTLSSLMLLRFVLHGAASDVSPALLGAVVTAFATLCFSVALPVPLRFGFLCAACDALPPFH